MTALDRWLHGLDKSGNLVSLDLRKVVIQQYVDDDGVLVALLQYGGVPRDWQRVGYAGGDTIRRAAFRALNEAKGNG